jgi:replicative DNA helicase
MAETLSVFESDLQPWAYWGLRAEDKIDAWAEGREEGRSTGFPSLDKWTRLIDGDLVVVAARPSMGKTAIGMQMAESVARQLEAEGDLGCVAIFSAEMSGWSLYLRMASALSGVNYHKARSGKCNRLELNSLKSMVKRIKTLPIFVDDNSGPTTKQMLEQLSRLNLDYPVRMMVFDFMELGGDRDTREDIRIGNIAHNLKGIAKTLQIPVVALSQLNREVDTRANKMPQLNDLRYSGMIEQLADVVLLLTRPEYYVETGQHIEVERESDLSGTALVQVAKNRNGPRGLVRLAFVKDKILFAELAQEK